MQFQAQSILSRQSRLNHALRQAGLHALALNPSPSLTYLTGLSFHLMERPIVAIFTIDNPILLVIPELEAQKTASLPFQAQVFCYGEEPALWSSVFQQAIDVIHLTGFVGIEPTRLRYLELKLIENAAPNTQLISAEETLAGLRMRKEVDEISAMAKAVQIAESALQQTLPIICPGMSERQLAAELTQNLLRAGSDAELPFAPIVSSGPNSANPHASPTDRPLSIGDMLVIDWGAYYDGYCSDLTRTFAIGSVDKEFDHIACLVKAANEAGRTAAAPGITAGSVDELTRSVIVDAGYGAFFTHRTGHGLGMEGHEAPYIRSGNPLELAPGMTFTIEPGIYLPERGGVRIEDDVVVTESGAESLSHLPRELKVIGS